RRGQADLLRDIVGPSPFRRVEIDAACLIGTGVQLATAIYEGRRFEDMPVLADALEEAGGRDEEVLAHCRGSGLHARGCCVIDLVLTTHIPHPLSQGWCSKGVARVL